VGRPLAASLVGLLTVVATPTVASARVSLAHGAPSAPSGWVLVTPKPVAAAHLIASVRGTAALHSSPGGPVVASVGSRTPFGSQRAFSVVRRHAGGWLGVTTPEFGDRRLAWIKASAGGLRYSHTRLEIVVDLSTRTLALQRGTEVLRRARVGIGRPGSPTPSGRFAVTDKLRGSAYSSYYGCCILALSATQPSLPSGWTGGNRIAIHGTPSSSDFGRAVSAGCVHASDADLRYLMRHVPLGTPVLIRP
jgi:L,D-transpeptidase catalytic domain